MAIAEMTESLEKKVESPGGFRKLVADTSATVTFSLAFGVVNELLISGMSFAQYCKSRASMLLIHAVVGRPYGIYRDFLHGAAKVKESGLARRALVDMAANASFFAPIYTMALYFSGADKEQITYACASSVLLSTVVGPAFGWYLDKIRGFIGVKPEYLDDKVAK